MNVLAANATGGDDAGVNLVSGLLANVAVPNGTAKLGRATSMVVAMLPHRRRLLYRVGGDSRWHVVDLAALDMTAPCAAPFVKAPFLGAANVTASLLSPRAVALVARCCPCAASQLLGAAHIACPRGTSPYLVKGCAGCRCCAS